MPKLDFAQRDVLMWGAIGLGGIVVIYLVVKVVIPQLTKAAATTVANIPAQLAHAATDGAGNLINEFTQPFADWWKGLDTAPPAAVNAGMGGTDFGSKDGATW